MIISCQTLSAGFGVPSLCRKDMLRNAGLISPDGSWGKDHRARESFKPVVNSKKRRAKVTCSSSLPTSGLSITPEEFIAAANTPPSGFDFLAGATTAEGFLFSSGYLLPRAVSADQLVVEMVRNFALQLTPDLRDGFARQGLTVYRAVTLASIIQREAVLAEEQPSIASVFLNRLALGMKLDSDPTVQYALGYNTAQATWWINPLSLADLQVDSAYNTYLYPGLPPSPISNPGLNALQAVAYLA